MYAAVWSPTLRGTLKFSVCSKFCNKNIPYSDLSIAVSPFSVKNQVYVISPYLFSHWENKYFELSQVKIAIRLILYYFIFLKFSVDRNKSSLNYKPFSHIIFIYRHLVSLLFRVSHPDITTSLIIFRQEICRQFYSQTLVKSLFVCCIVECYIESTSKSA